jgi:hypothetical protein
MKERQAGWKEGRREEEGSKKKGNLRMYRFLARGRYPISFRDIHRD